MITDFFFIFFINPTVCKTKHVIVLKNECHTCIFCSGESRHFQVSLAYKNAKLASWYNL